MMTSWNWQTLLVALTVGVCAVHAAWSLMPASLRRAIAQRLLGMAAWPAFMAQPLRRAVAPVGGACGGGCDGCGSDNATASGHAVAKVQPLVFHPRKTR